MGDVVRFGGQTTLDIPADRVLTEAVGRLDHVVVVGLPKEGGPLYIACSMGDMRHAHFHLCEAARRIIRMKEQHDGD